MTKKYKHEATGHIATETVSEKNYKVSYPQNFIIPKWIIENSNDWKEFIEEFEVLTFIKDNIITSFSKPFNHSYLRVYLAGGYKINSIKRLSDEIEFKLGDNVTISKLQKPVPFIISEFYLDCKDNHLLCNGECCGNGHVNITKIEHYKEPLTNKYKSMNIKTIEISGFVSCFNTLRKPYKKECRSSIKNNLPTVDSFGIYSTGYCINLDKKDLKLLQRLIKNGDEHAKAARLINVTAEIQAPLFWWSEMDKICVHLKSC